MRDMLLPHDGGDLIWKNRAPTPFLNASIDRWTRCFLEEDGIFEIIQPEYDLALMARTDGAIPTARIFSRSEGIIVGLEVIQRMTEKWFPELEILSAIEDGDHIQKNDIIVILQGAQNQILMAERVILNILSRLSGLATNVNRLTKKTRHRVAATRKTIWGVLDKWAIYLGGGLTHRLNRSESKMIKENDSANNAPGSSAIERLLVSLNSQYFDAVSKKDPNSVWGRFLTVEVKNLKEAHAVAEWLQKEKEFQIPSPTLLIDNLGPDETQRVISSLKKERLCEGIVIEASGSIREENLSEWDCVDADVLSMGSLTQGVKSLDLSLIIDEVFEQGL